MTTDTGEHMDDAMKTELLEKYGEREPKLFLQFDGFYPPTYPIEHDYAEDGYEIIASTTCELMNGASVRVLVNPTTEAGDAVALLRKTATYIERHGTPDVEPPTAGQIMRTATVLHV